MKVIQFQDKRTGSTFLQKCMNSHPEITALDEVFIATYKNKGIRKSGLRPFLWKIRNEKDKSWTLEKYMNWIFSQDENVSVKVMYNQSRIWKIFDYIVKKDMPVIHLFRRNHFKKIVSKANMARTDFYHIDKENGKQYKPESVIRKIKSSIKEDSYYHNALKNKLSRYITLYHEDMFGDIEGDITYLSDTYCKMICNFFGVEYFRMYANTKKKNKEDALSYFSQREKMKELLKSNGMENFLKI